MIDLAEVQEVSTEQDNVFVIPEINIHSFDAKLAAVSKKSMKLPGKPISYEVLDKVEREYWFGNRKKKVACLQIKIDAETPKVGDFTFVATLDHQGKLNIVRRVPTVKCELPEFYRTAPAYCDHCKTTRDRRDTYVVRNDNTGDLVQVGRNCLVDFMGHDALRCARMAEWLDEAVSAAREEGEYTGGSRSSWFELDEFLMHVACMIRHFGWTSRAAARDAGGMSTSDDALTNMFPPKKHKPEPVLDQDRELAAKALEWGKALSQKARLNDYEHNITVIASQPHIEWRSAGLAASMITAYLRDNSLVEEKKREKAQSAELGDMTAIYALFETAKKNLKKKQPIVILVAEDVKDGKKNKVEIMLSVAGERSQFPGSIQVTSKGSYSTRDWWGRVTTDGTFQASRKASVPTGTAEVLARFAADPDTVVGEYGRFTKTCSYCRKDLTDPRAIHMGYGASCARNWGRPFPTLKEFKKMKAEGKVNEG